MANEAKFTGRFVMPITLSEGQAMELSVTLAPVAIEPATLWGTVVDAETGSPISGATIELVGTPWVDTSSYIGSFRIEGIEPGTYTVRISHPDYETKTY